MAHDGGRPSCSSTLGGWVLRSSTTITYGVPHSHNQHLHILETMNKRDLQQQIWKTKMKNKSLNELAKEKKDVLNLIKKIPVNHAVKTDV